MLYCLNRDKEMKTAFNQRANSLPWQTPESCRFELHVTLFGLSTSCFYTVIVIYQPKASFQANNIGKRRHKQSNFEFHLIFKHIETGAVLCLVSVLFGSCRAGIMRNSCFDNAKIFKLEWFSLLYFSHKLFLYSSSLV